MLLAKKKFMRFGPIYRDPIPRFHVGARQRSLLTDLDLAALSKDRNAALSGYDVEPDGENYAFVTEDSSDIFVLKDEGGAFYRLFISLSMGAPQIYFFQSSPDGFVSKPIPFNGANYEWTIDGYFRWFDDLTDWRHISANADETLSISDAYASNRYAVPRANNLNCYFIAGAGPGLHQFVFIDMTTGLYYKPWVVEDSIGSFILEITEYTP